MSKEYIKGTVHTTTQGAEALAGVLPALGVEGCSVEDAADLEFIVAERGRLAWDYIEDNGYEGEVVVTFWVENGEAERALIEGVREGLCRLKDDVRDGAYGKGADFGRLAFGAEVVRDDWKDSYKESFRTFSPCEGVVVAPPWEAEDILENEEYIRLIIDPGMAFGTGSHETTAMCLARLRGLIKSGDRVLDAGTGSGILAIAAALMGAGEVHAVEMDEDAAASAQGNIAANGVGGRVALIIGDITEPGTLPEGARYELITANLSFVLIERLLPVFKGLLADGGALIISGLLDVDEGRAVKAFGCNGLRVAEVVKAGEWLMIEACKH
ncbi:MAG: 50S ribosomal protein L11 methyltransferase [Clostridiales bacterium]|nr:50S ribosomal protein L11 methyltransferase [Clostridiales bacterium]